MPDVFLCCTCKFSLHAHCRAFQDAQDRDLPKKEARQQCRGAMHTEPLWGGGPINNTGASQGMKESQC